MDIAKSIKILEQICVEDKYSRHNVRQMIKKDIGDELPDIVNGAVELLQKYV